MSWLCHRGMSSDSEFLASHRVDSLAWQVEGIIGRPLQPARGGCGLPWNKPEVRMLWGPVTARVSFWAAGFWKRGGRGRKYLPGGAMECKKKSSLTKVSEVRLF